MTHRKIINFPSRRNSRIQCQINAALTTGPRVFIPPRDRPLMPIIRLINVAPRKIPPRRHRSARESRRRLLGFPDRKSRPFPLGGSFILPARPAPPRHAGSTCSCLPPSGPESHMAARGESPGSFFASQQPLHRSYAPPETGGIKNAPAPSENPLSGLN